VRLSQRTADAVVRWDRQRAAELGPSGDDAPLFITLGRRRRDGSYTAVGRRCHQPVLAGVIARLGAAAELPAELAHPHALRHTCATELLRAGASVVDVRDFLGHASTKTTSIYLHSEPERQEAAVLARERGRLTLDEDRDRAVA
jgi:integrase